MVGPPDASLVLFSPDEVIFARNTDQTLADARSLLSGEKTIDVSLLVWPLGALSICKRGPQLLSMTGLSSTQIGISFSKIVLVKHVESIT